MNKIKMLFLLAFVTLSGCAGTGSWAPNDPTAKTQDQMNRDMQGCIAYGDQSFGSASLPGLSMSIRNSYVEDCMKRLGYHKE